MPAEIEVEARGLTLRWPGIGELSSIRPVCRLSGGAHHVGSGWTSSEGTLEASCGPLLLRLTATEEEDGRVRLALSASARESAEVTAVGICGTPLVDGAPPAWWIHSGYQSWDPADVVAAAAHPIKSWWTAAVAGPAGAGIAVASQSADRLATCFELSAGVLTALETSPTGGPPLIWSAAPGDRLELEPLACAAAPSAWQSLRAVAGGDRREAPVPVPVGWLSWYHYGPWVSEEDVIENAEVLREGALHGLGYRVVQIDDGWQQAYGDWRTNTKFGTSLGRVAAELGAMGQTAGVWTAPFLVSASADLASEAPPDWFIPDPATGERLIDPVHVSFGPMYVLDARRPEVIAHLEQVFADLFAAGIRYFKIDFLYAGAYAGVEALRAGVAAIRRAVGDSYILACGAPLQPLSGLVEGCRIGQDTATPIYDFESGTPLARVFGDEVRWIARNVACRSHLDGWFQLDPDVALVGANLSLDQARQLVTAVALCGGPFFASDDLTRLDPQRLALLTNPEVLALVGGPPPAPDWEPSSDGLSGIWRRGDGVLAAFNWTAPARRLCIEVERSARVRDLWNQVDLERPGDLLELELQESGVRLLKFEGGGRLHAWLE